MNKGHIGLAPQCLALAFVVFLTVGPALAQQPGGNSNLFTRQLQQVPVPGWSKLPDPFLRTPGYLFSLMSEPELTLEAILFDDARPQAVINGEIFSIGDQLPEGPKIINIDRGYILLEEGSSLTELVLPQSGTVRRVSAEIGDPSKKEGQ